MSSRPKPGFQIVCQDCGKTSSRTQKDLKREDPRSGWVTSWKSLSGSGTERNAWQWKQRRKLLESHSAGTACEYSSTDVSLMIWYSMITTELASHEVQEVNSLGLKYPVADLFLSDERADRCLKSTLWQWKEPVRSLSNLEDVGFTPWEE